MEGAVAVVVMQTALGLGLGVPSKVNERHGWRKVPEKLFYLVFAN